MAAWGRPAERLDPGMMCLMMQSPRQTHRVWLRSSAVSLLGTWQGGPGQHNARQQQGSQHSLHGNLYANAANRRLGLNPNVRRPQRRCASAVR